MINYGLLLSGKPILLSNDIKFYQPTLQEIVDMGENRYWFLFNIWIIKRKELIVNETEETKKLSDYEIWKEYVFSVPDLKEQLKLSVFVFFKTKIEFFENSHTIYIGEKESGLFLNEKVYNIIRDIFNRLISDSEASKEDDQYKETDNMSEREREMIRKMKSCAEKIEKTKNPDKKPEDNLGNKIVGLVAIGTYTFEQVYSMTMFQLNMLLKKYTDIQNFELRSMLSPYIDSKDSQENKYWLD